MTVEEKEIINKLVLEIDKLKSRLDELESMSIFTGVDTSASPSYVQTYLEKRSAK